ncbi:intein-containing DNA-directed RNA polymerase subunit 2 [Megavirus vitis]|nr:intein-containing DNA-directed RNA polymerase subunit 2 [Megavirus vitis]
MSKKSKEVEDVDNKYDPEPFFGLLDLFFERSGQILVSHHIDSFNQLIEETIPSILQSGENIISEKTTENKVIRYRLTFDDLGIKPPSLDNDEGLLYPLDAIRKQLSYSSKYTATVTQWQDIVDISTGNTETRIIGAPEKDVPIAKIPIMVKSKYCNLTLRPDLSCRHCKYDAGGYFIINGSEKVVLSVESMIRRKPMVFTQKDQNSLIYYVRVLSQPPTQLVGNPQTFTIRMKKDNSIILSVPYFKDVSIFTLIRAMGIENDEDIVDAILDVRREKDLLNQLSISMNLQNSPSMTQEEAMEKMIDSLKSTKTYSESNPETRAKQRRKYVEKIMKQYILPHVSSGTNNPKIDMLYKAYYICYMIHKLLKCYTKNSKDVEEYRGCDDRDSMVNKRIMLTGTLLGSLFKQFYEKMINDCNKIFRTKNADDKKPPNIIPHIKANTIEQGLRQALSTGVFGTQSLKGLSQMLNRMNHLHSLSYLRRVITPTVDASTNKMTSPRHLHNTQYGSVDPLETPEGPKTGIVKNMTMTEYITISMNSQIPIIENYLSGKLITLESVNKKRLHTYVKVFLNGNWLGVTDNIIKIHNDLRNMRFRGEIHKHVSFDLNFKLAEFNIYTDGGRLIRPYLTVTENKLNFKPEMLDQVNSWDEFIAKFPNVIEFVDKEEEQNMMLAVFPHYIEQAQKLMMQKSLRNAKDIDKVNRTNRYDGHVYQRYTHCEIHPCMILGLISSNIPFPDHNQSPRGIFQYNQARQAMGLYISDYRERTDISYILYHSQIPLVTSRASKYTGTHIFPSGENSIVAIASYTGLMVSPCHSQNCGKSTLW